MKKEVKYLQESTYSGQIMEEVKDYPYLSKMFTLILTGETVEIILYLEKTIREKEARIAMIEKNMIFRYNHGFYLRFMLFVYWLVTLTFHEFC